MATDAQLAANFENAKKSSGPKTAPGKRISSGNSTKHGLSGRAIVADDDRADPVRRDEIRRRRDRWDAELPRSVPDRAAAIEHLVALSLRIDDCMRAYEALFADGAEEARGDWEHSREVEAAALAEGLARRPERVVRQLASTKQGVELLLGRWEALGKSLELGSWDESDSAMALDLLGVAPALRKPGQTALDAPAGSDAPAHVRSVIAAEVARLRGRLETVLVASDARARGEAGSARAVLLSKPAALILRYEREATRRFRRALQDAYATRDDATELAPGPVPDPSPARPSSVEPEPEPEAVPVAADADWDWDEEEIEVESGPAPEPAASSAAAPSRLNRRARRARAARLRRLGL
jgi:hypothetical protein